MMMTPMMAAAYLDVGYPDTDMERRALLNLFACFGSTQQPKRRKRPSNCHQAQTKEPDDSDLECASRAIWGLAMIALSHFGQIDPVDPNFGQVTFKYLHASSRHEKRLPDVTRLFGNHAKIIATTLLKAAWKKDDCLSTAKWISYSGGLYNTSILSLCNCCHGQGG